MKTFKKMQKEVGMLTGTGVGLSIGIRAIKGVGATHGEAEGLEEIAAKQGLLGTVLGAGQVIGITKEAFNLKKKRDGFDVF